MATNDRRKYRYELCALIAAKGMSTRKLSLVLGKHENTAYRWCYGWNEPNARDMVRLSEILGVSVERIVRIFAD